MMQPLHCILSTVHVRLYREKKQEEELCRESRRKGEGFPVTSNGFSWNEDSSSEVIALQTYSRRALHEKEKITYCKKMGHQHDRCWSLHGRPNRGGRSNRGRNSFKSGRQQDDIKISELTRLLKRVVKSNLVINSEQKVCL